MSSLRAIGDEHQIIWFDFHGRRFTVANIFQRIRGDVVD
jgi:hypothetical protein